MSKEHEALKLCPFCGADAKLEFKRDTGTMASGMETPEPYVECAAGCCRMKVWPCDDWPYGQERGADTQEQAIAKAVAAWNTRQGGE